MNFKNLSKTFLAAVMLIAAPAHARWVADAGNDHCGLGTMLWGSQPKSISSNYSEISTNAILLNETFAVTSGTSGCKNDGWVNLKQSELKYVNANFEELKVEMAEGKGELLATFSKVLGCSPASTQSFNAMVQGKFETIYDSTTTSPATMLMNVKKQIQSDSELSTQCPDNII